MPAPEPDAALLNVILDQTRELHSIARTIPDHLSPRDLPLPDRVKDIVDSHQAVLNRIDQQEWER